jgi:hypothetical protein
MDKFSLITVTKKKCQLIHAKRFIALNSSHFLTYLIFVLIKNRPLIFILSYIIHIYLQAISIFDVRDLSVPPVADHA